MRSVVCQQTQEQYLLVIQLAFLDMTIYALLMIL